MFRALKLAGAAYLVYLGAQSLWAAVATRAHDGEVRSEARRSRPPALSARASSRNLGNPKMAVFFASLLPQFAPGGERVVRRHCSHSAFCSAR